MSSNDDQSSQEKKQKLEKDDFFVLHYDRETYYKKLNDHNIFDDEKGIMSDEDNDFIEEEAKIYYDAFEASNVKTFFFLLFLPFLSLLFLKDQNILFFQKFTKELRLMLISSWEREEKKRF